jgi:hypothetical protein
MKLFNGQLVLTSVKDAGVDSPATSWSIQAKFTSVNDFHLTDVKVGDIIFLNGYCVDDATSQLCRYVISTCAFTSDKKQLDLIVNYGETHTSGTAVFAPYVDEEHQVGMVGRLTSENGFTSLPTTSDGFSSSIVDGARNIDLYVRDEKFLAYVSSEIKKAVANIGSSSDKLPIAGGEITGNFAVDGNTVLKKTTITPGSNQYILDENGIDIAVKADAPVYKSNVSSANKITASDVKASSSNDVVETKSLSGVNVTNDVNMTATKKASTTVLVNGTEESDYIVNANGLTTDIELNSNGTTSAKVVATAVGDKGEIDLTAKTIKLNGVVSASSNITAPKMYQTDTSGSFDDTQLIPESHMVSYVKSYVDSKVGTATDTSALQAEIDKKANSADVYTQIQVDSLMQTIKAANVVTDANHRFITDDQITTYSNKQDKLSYVPENVANRGAASGYVPLNGDAKIDPKYLSVALPNGQVIALTSTSDFAQKLAANALTSRLYFVVPDSMKNDNTKTIMNNYRIYYIVTVTAEEAAADSTLVFGTQTAYMIGKYDPSIITTDWASIGNVPTTLVYKNTSGTLDDNLLPSVGVAGTYTKVTTDKYGRVIAGTSESTGGGAYKWYASADGNIIWYGNGDGITVSYTTNNVVITVPAGVEYTTATFKVAMSYVTSSIITVVYDKDHAFTSTKTWYTESAEGDGDVALSPMPTVTAYTLGDHSLTHGAGNTAITGNNVLQVGALTPNRETYVMTIRF